MPRLTFKTTLTVIAATAFTASPLLAAAAEAGGNGRKKSNSGIMRLGGPAQNGTRPMRLGGPTANTSDQLTYRVPGQGNGSGCQFCNNDAVRAFYIERDRTGSGSN